ncbi:MAG TPA: diguanylate cyclase [Thermoanaerobaculia bacterium]|nr:diguanylate cyclase [Thermoanaerobaculia bacterium]
MTEPLRVLLIEDSERDAARLSMELRRGGYAAEITRVETGPRLREELLRGATFDLVICDYVLPAFSAPEALTMVREAGIDLPFIVVSGAIGEDIAVEMMRSGAHDYVLKEKMARLVPAVGRELKEKIERSARREAETLFQAILRTSPHPSAVIDRNSGHIVHLSDSFINRLLGRREPSPNATLFDLVHFTTPERITQLLGRGGGTALYMVYVLDEQNRVANVRVDVVQTSYANVVIEDITEQHYLKAAFDAVADAVLVISSTDTLLYANRAAEEIFGALYFGMTISRELPARINDQSYEVRTTPFRFAGETHSSAVLTLRNVSEQEELLEASTHDPLTGLYNVRYFEEALSNHGSGALAMIDLDFFKPINDELGHAAGDRALIGFANLIRNVIRPSDVFARVGGDEFAILFPDTTIEDAGRIVARMYESLQHAPFRYDGSERLLSASCGLAALRAGELPEEAKRRVDEALYAAKRGGRGQYVIA